MKKLLAGILVLTLSSQALAEPPPVRAIPPGEDRIVPLRKGQEAPFDGQLFDTNTAIRWGNWLEQYQMRLKLDYEAQTRIQQARENYLNQVIRIEQEKYREVTEAQRNTILELEKKVAEPDPWYESLGFGLGLGVASTILVTAISVWAIDAAAQ